MLLISFFCRRGLAGATAYQQARYQLDDQWDLDKEYL
jgi:hypothetical protein